MLGRRLVLLPASAAASFCSRRRARMRLGCLLEHVAPRLPVASAALVGAGEVIAAAAVAGGSGGAGHAAVASTIAQLAVSAVAIASGACLSTKVDFLRPRIEQLPGRSPLYAHRVAVVSNYESYLYASIP
jgi:hypothetical protein